MHCWCWGFAISWPLHPVSLFKFFWSYRNCQLGQRLYFCILSLNVRSLLFKLPGFVSKAEENKNIEPAVHFFNSFSSFLYSSSPPPLQSRSWFWQWWAGQYCCGRYDNCYWTKWFSWWNHRLQTYIFPSFLLGFKYFDILYLTTLQPCHTNIYKFSNNVNTFHRVNLKMKI